MKKILIISFLSTSLASCAYSIKEIDVSKKEPSCIRECLASYSPCVSQGNQIGFKTETLRACKQSYEICTTLCPAK